MAQKQASESRPSRLIARQVRKARNDRGWSAQRLAEELQKVGLPWDRTIIANLENGRRQAVSVEELLALSYVLAVPPILMLAPLDEVDGVSITPDLAVPPGLAHRWIVGEAPPVDAEHYARDIKEWRRASRPLYLYGRLHDAAAVAQRAHAAVTSAEYVGDPRRLQDARRVYVDALRELIGGLEAVIEAGLKAPRFDREWREDAERAGLSWPKGAPVADAVARLAGIEG